MAIASPAPFTTQPTFPSSLMKVRLALRASISLGASALSSRNAASAGWR